MTSTVARLRRSGFGDLPLVVVALMCVIACLGYSGVFGGWSFLTPVVVASVGASACAWASRRWGLLLGETILLSVISFFAVGLVTTQWVPSLSSPADFATGLTRGWADLLSSQTPTTLNPRRAIVPFTTAWVGTALAQEFDRRSRYGGFALVGVLVGLIATSLFSTEVRALARIQGPALIGLTIVLALIHRNDREQSELSVDSSVDSTGRMWSALLTLGAIMGIAALVGPSLPLANANERFDLRDRQENPWDPLESPSPLVTFKADLKREDDDRTDIDERAMFRVIADEPVLRWTIAVMSAYDGVVWQVADPTTDTAAQFVPVDPQLPRNPDRADTPEVDATVEILALRGPWVPHGGDPVELQFDDRGEIRMNLSTRTVAHPTGLAEGDTYSLTTQLHPNIDDLNRAMFTVDDRSTDIDLVPAPVRNLAADLVEGIDFGGSRIVAIQELLQTEGFYDSGPAVPPGHSYFRLGGFIDNPERIVGYEEQYAATAAVLSRIASVPTRVVVGYSVPEARYVDGQATIFADDASAWIEVDVEGVGWVPVDVTPDRSRIPSEEQIGRVTRNVAVPNDPPSPPPPQAQERDDDELEEELDDEEDEEEEETEDDGSLLGAIFGRPAVVAGLVAISPFLGLALLGLFVFALKRLRRRRRRNSDDPRLQVVGAWAELVDRFEEVGVPVEANATPSEIVASVRAGGELETAEPELVDLASMVSRSAFAAKPPSDADVEQAWSNADRAGEAAVGSLSVLERTRVHFDPRPLLRRSPRQEVDE